ncbi:MAG: carboxypeptidase regulatory-like domain-containing protein, partial [Capsulimonadaceae bacterium]|nr:carboxypeptidase regulatory-like domain-containing protein [Capsulimonadaceae bacterium]
GANGQAAFSGLASGASYPYTVSAANYNAYSGSATAGTNATATLVRTLVSETITVTSDGTTAVSGASVTLNGVTVVSGANGQAAFGGLSSGASYPYTISATNYNAYSGSATAGTNATATLVRTLVSETITVTSDGTTPIAGATVRLFLSLPTVRVSTNRKALIAPIQTATTGSDGTATFTGLASGQTYAYTVGATNYDNRNGTFSAGTPVTVTLNRTLVDETITVTSDGTTPISGASVTLNNTTVSTGDAGTATFTGLLAGQSYAYTITATNYNTVTGAATAGTAITATMTLAIVSETITVTSDGTTPIAGATVTLNNSTTTTNQYGQAVFTGLTSSKGYAYTVTATNYDTYNGNATAGTPATITMVRTLVSETITVTSDGTTPISGASVTLNNTTVSTGSDGTATFTGLSMGEVYTFYVSATNYVGIQSNCQAGSNLIVTLTSSLVSSTITVVDGSGDAISGARVIVNNTTKFTDANGQVTFTGLVRWGAYTYSISASGYNSASGYIFGGVSMKIWMTAPNG